MVGTGHVDKGAIFGVDGSQWAITPGFAVRPSSMQSQSRSADASPPEDAVTV